MEDDRTTWVRGVIVDEDTALFAAGLGLVVVAAPFVLLYLLLRAAITYWMVTLGLGTVGFLGFRLHRAREAARAREEARRAAAASRREAALEGRRVAEAQRIFQQRMRDREQLGEALRARAEHPSANGQQFAVEVHGGLVAIWQRTYSHRRGRLVRREWRTKALAEAARPHAESVFQVPLRVCVGRRGGFLLDHVMD